MNGIGLGSAFSRCVENAPDRPSIEAERSPFAADQGVRRPHRLGTPTETARAATDRDARAVARDEAAERRDERATAIDHAVAACDGSLAEKLAWLRVAAAGDRAKAAVDRERAAEDRVDAARDRAALEAVLASTGAEVMAGTSVALLDTEA